MSSDRHPSTDPERGRILTAATDLFAVQGYDATSEARLLVAADLGNPDAFHAHFADKEECFLATYDLAIDSARPRLSAALAGQASWPQRVAAGLAALLDFIDSNVAAARVVLIESQLAGLAAFERYRATLERLAPFIREGYGFSAPSAHLPPILDSALIAGVAFSLRHQLLRGEPACDAYDELLRILLLPSTLPIIPGDPIAAHLKIDTLPNLSARSPSRPLPPPNSPERNRP